MRLIDADKVQKPIYAEEDNITGFGMTYDEMCGYNDGIDVTWSRIELAPTVDAVEVVHGCWVVEKTATGGEYTRCSKCGLDFSWKDTKFGLHKLDMRGCDYCPACGTKMDEVSK